jgi:hypothetical protein
VPYLFAGYLNIYNNSIVRGDIYKRNQSYLQHRAELTLILTAARGAAAGFPAPGQTLGQCVDLWATPLYTPKEVDSATNKISMSFSKGGQWTPSESSGIGWNSPHVDGISNGFQQNPAESIRKTRFLSLRLLYRETRGPSGGHWIPLASWWSAVAAAISQCRPVPMSRLLPPRILLIKC